MLTAITAAILVGKPFYLECRRVPEIEIAVNENSRDERERWESRVIVSELRHATGEAAFFFRCRGVCKVVRADHLLLVPRVRLPCYRYGKSGPWVEFPRGTFSAPGTFTLTLRAEIEWETWVRHCDEIRQGERRSYDGSYRSYPPQPKCWTPSGFDKKSRLREVGIEDTEDRLMELLLP